MRVRWSLSGRDLESDAMKSVLDRVLFFCLLVVFSFLLLAFIDVDRDNLPDDWEVQHNLSTNAYSSSDLIAWWQLDDNAGSSARDRSTNNLPLTLI